MSEKMPKQALPARAPVEVQQLEQRQLMRVSAIDTLAGPDGSNPVILGQIPGGIIYLANGTGTSTPDLWMSDGGNHAPTLLKADIGVLQSFTSGGSVVLDGKVYFAFGVNPGGDLNFLEYRYLAVTDGTSAGTKTIFDGGASSTVMLDGTIGHSVLFDRGWQGGYNRALFSLDTITGGTAMLAEPLKLQYGLRTVHFDYSESGGNTLIKYWSDYPDLGNEGTIVLPGSITFASSYDLRSATSVTISGIHYYAFDDGVHGSELWMDDGSGSLSMVADLYDGPDDSSPAGLVYVNGRLMFAATTPDTGREIYVIDIDPPAPASLPPPQLVIPPLPPPSHDQTAASFFVFGHMLKVIGDKHGNSMSVLRKHNSLVIQLDGVTKTIPLGTIRDIRVYGNQGSDHIHFDVADHWIVTRLYGGAGNDTIFGGTDADRIYAGDGDDWISAGDGNDTIYGEAGNDRLFGGDGTDYLVGGAGANVLRGEGGKDRIIATRLIDDIRGNLLDLIGYN